jgi:membrane fusion protein, multidrug efflux system
MNSTVLRTSFISLGVATLFGCGKSDPPPAPPPPQVGVVQAEPSDVPLTRSLVGRLSSYYSANVTARVSGVLMKRLYTEGSEVKAGQVLFEIDPAWYQTVLNTDKATLAQDQATYTNDHVTAGRYHKLLQVGSVSQQTVDDADAAERSAAAKVQADQAALDGARVNLDYTKVTSPITGIAGQQQVTAGAVVGNGTTDSGAGGTLLTTVEQIDPVYVNFTISAAELIALREAQRKGSIALAPPEQTTVQVVLPGGKTYDKPGILDFSDVLVNSTTGAISLRARVPNPQHELLPGMYVSLNVDLGQRNHVFTIPQQGILRDVAGSYVMVVGADGKAQRRTVEAKDSYENNWIVTSGLSAGDRVIVASVQAAHEGALVSATPWKGPDEGPNKGTGEAQSRTAQLAPNSPGASNARSGNLSNKS